jgi:hypothetical protein
MMLLVASSTKNAFQDSFKGAGDAFVAKISIKNE